MTGNGWFSSWYLGAGGTVWLIYHRRIHLELIFFGCNLRILPIRSKCLYQNVEQPRDCFVGLPEGSGVTMGFSYTANDLPLVIVGLCYYLLASQLNGKFSTDGPCLLASILSSYWAFSWADSCYIAVQEFSRWTWTNYADATRLIVSQGISFRMLYLMINV